MNQPLRLGLVGLGKIAHAQHLPAIAAEEGVQLTAVADPAATVGGLMSYADIGAMLREQPAIDAVVLCQPPQARFTAAREALLAGKHVFLEKPPGATVSEVEVLLDLAASRGVTLFAGWHSREAAAVLDAKHRLASVRVRSGSISWKEDVRVWHPGQRWIWQAGGFGVFDPGINALSILTEILPEPVRVVSAELFVPANCAAPIAADLMLETTSGAIISAEFDFRQTGRQTWDIEVESDAGVLLLSDGGNALTFDRQPQPIQPEQEYARLYRRFLELIQEGRSEVDLAPLRLVADACLKGRWTSVDPFDP